MAKVKAKTASAKKAAPKMAATKKPKAGRKAATRTRKRGRPTASKAIAQNTNAVDNVKVQMAMKAVDAASAALKNLKSSGVSKAPSKAPDFAAEIGAIDFNKMISGPLQAAVDAQVASSLASIEFINAVGFKGEGDDRELVMVDFSHKKVDVNDDGEAVPSEIFIKVPLLAMVQVPSLRIEHVVIDFNVKLNSVETANTSQSLGVDASVQGGWGPVKFKVSAAYKRSSSRGIKVEREYALNVNVKAVQDEMAPGLERILNILAG